MNLRSKRCLFNLLAWASMVSAVSAQTPLSEGVVRLGQAPAEQLPPPITSLDGSMGQVNLGDAGGFGYSNVDRRFWPKVNIDTRGGGSYGYDPGYTNVGIFMPFAIEADEAIVWIDARGMVTHDGRGGANVGAGWRWWMKDVDRIVGLSAWYDNDAGNRHVYNQIGLSAESLGRYIDYRINGYIPVGTRSNVLSSVVDPTATSFQGNGLFFTRTSIIEQTFTGFDAELGGPVPIIGRYGVNAYVGGYHFLGNGPQDGSYTGVSGRFMAQINEDLQFGVQLTDDHKFGTNAQFQIFVTLPDGRPSRWLRNPTVQDRLTQSVYRQNRVMAHIDTHFSLDQAINPKDGLPYFVAHIDPNAAAGTGTVENPFGSIADYLAQPVASQKVPDIIYVRPRLDDTTTNLDTAPTFTLYDGQRLLSTSVSHTFMAANFPGQLLPLPVPTGFAVGDPLPQLFNSAGGDVITLAAGNVQCLEVSGFEIIGAGGGGNGISGTNNSFVLINRNEIHGAFNGINLVNLTDGISPSIIQSNELHDNLNDGFHLLNIGGPSVSTLELRDNLAYGNGDDGFDIAADVGSAIGGLIDGNTTVPPAGGNQNGDAGLALSSVGGFLNFNTPAGQQISNNNFSNNDVDGVFVDVTLGGDADLLFVGNTISSNIRHGIYVPASDNSLINLVIGGPDDTTDRNTITGNSGSGIVFDLSNTANGVTAHIENNLLDGNRDGVLVSVVGNSVFGPAVGANTTDIFDNIISNNTRDGIRLERRDSGDLNLGVAGAAQIHDNTIQLNTGDGLAVISSDTAAPPVFVATEDNLFDHNGSDGLSIDASDDSVVNFDSNRDFFTGNGANGLNTVSNDNSIINTTLTNVVATGNFLDGLHTVANANSQQNITVTSPPDPNFAGISTFSSNGNHGIFTNGNETSKIVISLTGVDVNDNSVDGWNISRLDASLITASATDTSFSDNGGDGIEFAYVGSPPGDPNQQMSGTPNTLDLNNVIASSNDGNGFLASGGGDAVLLTNFVTAEFNGNQLNGISISTELGSTFGVSGANKSIFDNVIVNGNVQDGIHIDESAFLVTGSQVFLDINTNTGNTDISGNGDDGIHVVSGGLLTDVTVRSTNGNQLTINGNTGNGVRWDITNSMLGDSHQLSVDSVTLDQNQGDGVQFNIPVGAGSLTLTDNTITNSGDDGVNINATALGNVLGTSTGTATIVATDNIIDGSFAHGVNIQIQGANNDATSIRHVDAQFLGTANDSQQITNSGLNGVNIEVRGATGDTRSPTFGGGTPNRFVFDDNRIALNGTRGVANQSHGIFYLANAGTVTRTASGTTSRRFPNAGSFDDGRPAGVPIDFNVVGLAATDFNSGNNNPTLFNMSNYMNLRTENNSTLEITDNTIEFNGADPGAPGEGVFINVSTLSYVSANVDNNTFTGNGSSDFRSRSFIATDVNGNPIIPPASVQGGTPGANDVLFMDDTAQLDLQLTNNTGQNIQPVGPGAIYPADAPAKGIGPRNVQIFQVDNSIGGGLNTNTFTNIPVTQQTLFLNAGYHTTTTPWSLNNVNFTQDYGTSLGNPFLP